MDDEVSATQESTAPSWQLTSEELINTKDNVLTFDNDKHKVLHLSFEVNVSDSDKNKVLLIAVKSDSDKPYNSTVTLYVAASNVQPLKFDVSHFGYVDNRQDVFKIYEAYVPHLKNETYVVELTPCYGKAEMFISRDFRQLLNNKYEAAASHLTNGRLYALLENKARVTRKFLIAVKSLNNATDEYKDYPMTEFRIEARKYPTSLAKNTYLERFYIPKDGEIEWELLENDYKLKVTWPKIFNTAGTEEIPSGFTSYDVYVSKEGRADLESPCTIAKRFTPVNSEPITDNSYIIDLDKDEFEDAKNIYINVVGHVNQDEQSGENSFIDYPIAYHPLAINKESFEGAFEDEPSILLWIILIAVIIVLILGIIFFYRRYRKVKSRLDFEVREVRHADFGQEMKSTKVYNRFADPESSNN